MTTTRRTFLQSGAAAGLGAGLAGCSSSEPAQAQGTSPAAESGPHPAIQALKPMPNGKTASSGRGR
jgi:hypothetical protein